VVLSHELADCIAQSDKRTNRSYVCVKALQIRERSPNSQSSIDNIIDYRDVFTFTAGCSAFGSRYSGYVAT